MGKPTGFKEFPRQTSRERDPAARVGDWNEFAEKMPVAQLRDQGARCMDCGIPFCHTGDLMAGMAAGYAFGIARNHPFVDANKRSAWVVCRTFLRLNRRNLDAPPQEAFLSMLQLAEGTMSEDQFAAWIRTHLREP